MRGLRRVHVPDLARWDKGVPVPATAQVWFDMEEHAGSRDGLPEELFKRIIMRVTAVVNRRVTVRSMEDVEL